MNYAAVSKEMGQMHFTLRRSHLALVSDHSYGKTAAFIVDIRPVQKFQFLILKAQLFAVSGGNLRVPMGYFFDGTCFRLTGVDKKITPQHFSLTIAYSRGA